jgi:hypothetical protein
VLRQDLIALFCEHSSRSKGKGDFLRKQGYKVDLPRAFAFVKNLPSLWSIAPQKKGDLSASVSRELISAFGKIDTFLQGNLLRIGITLTRRGVNLMVFLFSTCWPYRMGLG